MPFENASVIEEYPTLNHALAGPENATIKPGMIAAKSLTLLGVSLFTNRREGVFSETGLPVYGVPRNSQGKRHKEGWGYGTPALASWRFKPALCYPLAAEDCSIVFEQSVL